MTDLYTSNPADLAVIKSVLGAKPLARPSTRWAVRLNASNSAGLTAYETWLGGNAGGLLAFCTGTNTTTDTLADVLVGAASEISIYSALNRKVLWTVATTTFQPGEGGLDVLAGSQDAYLNSIFSMLAAGQPTGPIQVRLNHEMNFALAYSYGACFLTPAQYVALDQYCKDKARAISNRFEWVWCPNWNVTGTENLDIDPTPWYPGDGYVDHVWPDAYMQYGNVVTGAGRNVQQAINWMFTAPYGLNWFAKFAAAHGKTIGLSEYGIDDDRLSGWFNRLYGWADEVKAAWFSYWDKTSPGFATRISDDSKTILGAAYKAAVKGTQVVWTPLLEFGQNLYNWIDPTDAATITVSGSQAASVTDKGYGSPGAAAQATAGSRPTIGTRNGKGSFIFDGGDDNLIQTVLSTLTPAMNDEKTTFLYGLLDAAHTGFQYFLSEADSAATVSKRSIGFHNGIIRMQSAGSAEIAVQTLPPLAGNVKAIDASIIMLFGPAHDTAFNETIQASVNGSWLSTDNRRGAAYAVTPTRRVLGADATNSGAIGNYVPYTAQAIGGVNYRISQRVSDRLSGWLAWQFGRQADLRADHPYKAAAPLYGMLVPA